MAHLKPSCYSATASHASLLGIFFIDDYDDFSVPSQAAIYIKIMQKIKEKGEAHQHGDVFRSELVLFFCDTLVDTC